MSAVISRDIAHVLRSSRVLVHVGNPARGVLSILTNTSRYPPPVLVNSRSLNRDRPAGSVHRTCSSPSVSAVLTTVGPRPWDFCGHGGVGPFDDSRFGRFPPTAVVVARLQSPFESVTRSEHTTVSAVLAKGWSEQRTRWCVPGFPIRWETSPIRRGSAVSRRNHTTHSHVSPGKSSNTVP